MDWLQLSSSLIAIVLLAWATGKIFPSPEGLTSNRIVKNYIRYAPNSTPATLIISQDKQSAIVAIKDTNHKLGLVTQLGDKAVCRTLVPDTSIEWKIEENILIINHGDFTQPSVTLVLSAEDIDIARKLFTDFDRTDNAA